MRLFLIAIVFTAMASCVPLLPQSARAGAPVASAQAIPAPSVDPRNIIPLTCALPSATVVCVELVPRYSGDHTFNCMPIVELRQLADTLRATP